MCTILSSSRVRLPPHVRPASSSGAPSSARSEDAGRALASPLQHPAPAAAREPLPLLAPLPLLPGLVLAPLAALQTAQALRKLGATRVVLLLRPGTAAPPAASPLAAIGHPVLPLGGGPVAAGPWGPGGAGYSSSPPASGRQSGGLSGRWPQGSENDPRYLVSPSLQSTAGSLGPLGHTPRTQACGTPMRVLRLSGAAAAVYPEVEAVSSSSRAGAPAAGEGGAPDAAWAGSGQPSSARPRRVLHSGRIHPLPSDSVGSSPRMVPRQPGPVESSESQPQFHEAVGPTPGEGAALLRVLSDPALAAVAEACSASGAACEVLFAPGSAAALSGSMQLAVLLERWLSRMLPLLAQPAAGGTVVLAVEQGCEAEAALACVACQVQVRGWDLFQGLVAASQWGVDLHLEPQHRTALQHWAASQN